MSEMPNGAITQSPALDQAIVNPTVWANEEQIHATLAWLRQHDPVRQIKPEGFAPFWSITRYADIKAIEANRAFICDPRPTLAPVMVTQAIEALTGRKHLVRSLVQMDDPDHRAYRMLTQGWFMGSNLRRLQGRIDELARQSVDQLLAFDGQCDFVKDVAMWYPLRVIMSVLGVPEKDEPYMLKLTQELFGAADPDVQRSFEITDINNVIIDFERYFAGITADRRANPTDDVATVIANATINGKPIPVNDANGYYIIIATAGHDTTSASTAGGLLALLQNPDEFARLRSDVERYLPTFIDEAIRWVTPVRHFMRTATEDTEVGGQLISKGESVILWYPSANRDESVFTAPFEFRVDRTDAKQLAFGFGAHVCLGQHLARMEMTALFKELLRRVKHIELAGEPRYTQSTFVGGLKNLPIRFTAA